MIKPHTFLLAFPVILWACGPDSEAPEATENGGDARAATGCVYTVGGVVPGWTAYKTTDRVPVSGIFADSVLDGAEAADSLVGALTGLSIRIDSGRVDSQSPQRDSTLVESFFGLFAGPEILGEVVSATGDGESGTVTIRLTMNALQRELDFPYTVDETGGLNATHRIEMADFGLESAYTAIHSACETLHTGPDGVSVTGTDVLLQIDAQVSRSCS